MIDLDFTAKFIAGFEGFVGTVYLDAVGVETIGYGETRRDILERYRQSGISEQDAMELLKQRVQEFADAVEVRITNSAALTPNRHAALTSLAYNIGAGIGGFATRPPASASTWGTWRACRRRWAGEQGGQGGGARGADPPAGGGGRALHARRSGHAPRGPGLRRRRRSRRRRRRQAPAPGRSGGRRPRRPTPAWPCAGRCSRSTPTTARRRWTWWSPSSGSAAWTPTASSAQPPGKSLSTAAPAPPPNAPGCPPWPGCLLSQGEGGDARQAQWRLKERGWGIADDGVFGPKTEAIVRKYQTEGDVDERRRHLLRDPRRQRHLLAGDERLRAQVLGERDVGVVRRLHARRVDVQVEVVVGAGVGAGFEAVGLPRGAPSPGPHPPDGRRGSGRRRSGSGVRDAQERGHDRARQFGLVAHQQRRLEGPGRRAGDRPASPAPGPPRRTGGRPRVGRSVGGRSWISGAGAWPHRNSPPATGRRRGR